MKSRVPLLSHVGFLATGFLVYFLIYFDVLIRGEGTLVRGFDGSVQSFAWLSKIARDWSALEPPLWDFTSFSGTSFIGELQTGVLYPGNILLGWISPVVSQHSLDVYIFVHYVLAFYFMALFLKSCRFHTVPTLVGAYAFASYLDWVQPHRFVGMVYLPLVLLLFHKGAKNRERIFRNPWFHLCGMVLGLMILAGHIQPYLHSVIALLLFATIFGWAPDYRFRHLPVLLKQLSFVGLISALFSAPQWMLSLEHFSYSYRWAPDRTAGLEKVPYEVYGFVDVLAPELLDYLLNSWIPVAFFFSLPVILLSRGHIRRVALFGVLLLIFATLAGLGDRGYLSRVTYYIPGLNSAREATRYVFLILFASSTLLAVMVETLPRGIWWLWQLRRKVTMSLTPHLPPKPEFWLQILVFLVLLLPLWFHSSVFLRVQPNSDPLSPVQLYQEGTIIRFLKQEQRLFRIFNFKQCMAPNLGNAFSLLTVRGHRATILRNYFDFFSGALDDPLDPRFGVLGVKYIISPEPIEGLRMIMREKDRYLYASDNALPIFHRFVAETEEKEEISLDQIEFSANSVKLILGQPVKGLLLFSQPFFPGWQARVEEEWRDVHQVGIFMGVELASDERKIEFHYRPRLFWVGMGGLGLTLTALAACPVLNSRPGPNRRLRSVLRKES